MAIRAAHMSAEDRCPASRNPHKSAGFLVVRRLLMHWRIQASAIAVAPFVNNILGPAANTGGTFAPAGDKPRTADGFAAIFAALFAATQPTAQSAQAFPASGNAGMDIQA